VVDPIKLAEKHERFAAEFVGCERFSEATEESRLIAAALRLAEAALVREKRGAPLPCRRSGALARDQSLPRRKGDTK